MHKKLTLYDLKERLVDAPSVEDALVIFDSPENQTVMMTAKDFVNHMTREGNVTEEILNKGFSCLLNSKSPSWKRSFIMNIRKAIEEQNKDILVTNLNSLKDMLLKESPNGLEPVLTLFDNNVDLMRTARGYNSDVTISDTNSLLHEALNIGFQNLNQIMAQPARTYFIKVLRKSIQGAMGDIRDLVIGPLQPYGHPTGSPDNISSVGSLRVRVGATPNPEYQNVRGLNVYAQNPKIRYPPKWTVL